MDIAEIKASKDLVKGFTVVCFVKKIGITRAPEGKRTWTDYSAIVTDSTGEMWLNTSKFEILKQWEGQEMEFSNCSIHEYNGKRNIVCNGTALVKGGQQASNPENKAQNSKNGHCNDSQQSINEVIERRKIRGMCMSYSKDMLVAGKLITIKDLEPIAESMYNFIMETTNGYKYKLTKQELEQLETDSI